MNENALRKAVEIIVMVLFPFPPFPVPLSRRINHSFHSPALTRLTFAQPGVLTSSCAAILTLLRYLLSVEKLALSKLWARFFLEARSEIIQLFESAHTGGAWRQ